MRRVLAVAIAAAVAAAATTALAGGRAAAEPPQADLDIDVSGPTEAIWPEQAALSLRYKVRVGNRGPGTSPGAHVVISVRRLPANGRLVARMWYGGLGCARVPRAATVWLCKLRRRDAGAGALINVTVVVPRQEERRLLEVKAQVFDRSVVDRVTLSNSDVVETTIDRPTADLQISAGPLNTYARDLGNLLLLDDSGRGRLKIGIGVTNRGPSATRGAMVFIGADRQDSLLGTVVDGAGPRCRLEGTGDIGCFLPELARDTYAFRVTMPVDGAGPLVVDVEAVGGPVVQDPNSRNNRTTVRVVAR